LTRLAVIADTHLRGGRAIPELVVELAAGCDVIVHAGDIADGATLDAFVAIGPPLIAVAGNVDLPEVHERLPEEAAWTGDGARICVVHDAGPSKGRLARMRRRFPDADAVIFGHSHIPLHESGEGFQIFNPGSATQRRRAPRHTMGIAHVEDGQIRFELVALD
jgi:putative phosphoesterase